jgi:hypothetical protein
MAITLVIILLLVLAFGGLAVWARSRRKGGVIASEPSARNQDDTRG